LAKETKLPVAEMVLDSLGAPARFIWSTLPPEISTQVDAGRQGPDVQVFPVPTGDRLQVEWGLPGAYRQMEVFAATVELVTTVGLGGRERVDMDFSGKAPGIYLLRLVPEGPGPATVRRIAVR
jgi:hypothetical protein